MYERISGLMKELGDSLVVRAGSIKDIGVKKQWLTEDDLRVEQALTELIKTFPGEHAVYAEEINDQYTSAENVWVIDPISHTQAYIRGLPHYAITIAHIKNGEIVFGAVYDPSMGELFYAEKGKGTYLNGERVNVSESNKTPFILFNPSTGLGRFSKETVKKIFGEILELGDPVAQIKNYGSYGVHYAWVACGRADAAIALMKDSFPEFAGKILIEEAGGIFQTVDNKPLGPDTRAIVVSNKEMHSKVWTIVQRSL